MTDELINLNYNHNRVKTFSTLKKNKKHKRIVSGY